MTKALTVFGATLGSIELDVPLAVTIVAVYSLFWSIVIAGGAEYVLRTVTPLWNWMWDWWSY